MKRRPSFAKGQLAWTAKGEAYLWNGRKWLRDREMDALARLPPMWTWTKGMRVAKVKPRRAQGDPPTTVVNKTHSQSRPRVVE